MTTNFIDITRIEIATTSITTQLADSLTEKISELSPDPSIEFNLWDYVIDDYDFSQLKKCFVDTANDLIKRCGNSSKHLITSRAWVNNYTSSEYLAPHHHGNIPAVGIVYLQADSDCGDLLIQDPMATNSWISRPDNRDSRRTGRVSIPIIPTKGLIVVMPGFLIHSTEPTGHGKNRMIISTNFKFA